MPYFMKKLQLLFALIFCFSLTAFGLENFNTNISINTSNTFTSPNISLSGTTTLLADDAAIADLYLPTSSACLGANENIYVLVKNEGTNTIAIGAVSVSLSGDVTIGPITNTGSIAAGAVEELTFTVDLSTVQTYNITATLTMTGDGLAGNNTDNSAVTKSAPTGTLPISCDFTNYFDPNIGCPGFIDAAGLFVAMEPFANMEGEWQGTIDNTAAINIFGTSIYDWILTPTFVCGATTAFDMKIAITEYDDIIADANGMLGTDDAVYVHVSTDCGETWTTLHTFNDANTTGIISNTLTTIDAINLSAYNGQLIQVGIQASAGAVDEGADYDFHITDINIDNIANLPVEMTSFTATAEGTTNVLAWETASEENNAHFDVQRSTNGTDFERIDKIEGNGTTVEVSNYSFVDEAPATVSYYRLHQVDLDGKMDYSDVVTVKREMLEGQLNIAPNPVTSRLNVTFNTTTETATFRVFDVRGKLVRNVEQSTNVGANNISLNISELAQGMYFLEVISDNEIQRVQFIKK